MLVQKLLLSSLILSSIAFARPAPKGVVISEITAEATNGGFNPSFYGVRLKGHVAIAGNACTAAGIEVSLDKSVKHGQTIYTAHTKTIDSGRICPMFIDANFPGVAFDKTLILNRNTNPAESVFVNNVGRDGNLVSLEFLVNANAPIVNEPVTEEPVVETPVEQPEACNSNVICTMEYNPTTCTDSAGRSFHGSNGCAAKGQARYAACVRGETLESSDLHCSSSLSAAE